MHKLPLRIASRAKNRLRQKSIYSFLVFTGIFLLEVLFLVVCVCVCVCVRLPPRLRDTTYTYRHKTFWIDQRRFCGHGKFCARSVHSQDRWARKGANDWWRHVSNAVKLRDDVVLCTVCFSNAASYRSPKTYAINRRRAVRRRYQRRMSLRHQIDPDNDNNRMDI